MQDYVEAMCDAHEREETEAEFYHEHGIEYSDYLRECREEYEESFEER